MCSMTVRSDRSAPSGIKAKVEQRRQRRVRAARSEVDGLQPARRRVVADEQRVEQLGVAAELYALDCRERPALEHRTGIK